MKKFNKGMVITMAAMIAAAALTGCGNSAAEIVKSASAKAVQAAAETPVADNAAKAVEMIAEYSAENKPAAEDKAAEDTAKQEKKNDKNEKSEKNAETAKDNKTEKNTVISLGKNDQQAKTAKQEKAPETNVTDKVHPVYVEGDMFAGSYAEEIAGRGSMEITRNNDGTYSVQVDWSSSAFEKNSWNFSGEFDGRGTMNYTNCRKTTVAFDENGDYACDSCGIMTPYTTYTMGSGRIKFLDEGVLEWHDDMGDILPGTTFVICKQSRHTKADEIGTAGSRYFEDENSHTKADEIGTAGSCYYENENGYGEWMANGTFFEVTGRRITLDIAKNNKCDNTYDVIVRGADSAFAHSEYHFTACYVNDTLVYTDGYCAYVVYNENGELESYEITCNDNSGVISYTGAAGLRWTDSDGSDFVFMSDITLA